MNLTDELSRPFDKRFIDTVNKGSHSEDYVNHALVCHRLNTVLGVGEWSFRIVDVPTFTDDKGQPHVLHVLAEISMGGGIPAVRQEIGVPNRLSKYQDEVKAAVSDALKRCAMRLGVGIQLWHEVEQSDKLEMSSALPPKSATPLGGTAGAEASGGAKVATSAPPDTPSDGGAAEGGEDLVPVPSSGAPFDALEAMEAPSFDAIVAMVGGKRARAKDILNDVAGTNYTAATIKDATAWERNLAVAAIEEGAS